MGSEISAFIVEPILGIIAIVLSIFAIIKEHDNQHEAARWLAIAALVVTVLLIIADIGLEFVG